MKLGVFDPVFGSLSLDEMLDKIAAAGLNAVEIARAVIPAMLTVRQMSCLRASQHDKNIWKSSRNVAL